MRRPAPTQAWSSLRSAFLKAVASQQHRDIVDFDDHLDDVSLDYFNPGFAVPAVKFALPGQLA